MYEPLTSRAAILRHNLRGRFLNIILEYFVTGFDPESPEHRSRFSELYLGIYRQACPLDTDDVLAFTAIGHESALPVGNNFYGFTGSGHDKLKSILLNVHAQGANTVFYSLLHQAHFSQLKNIGLQNNIFLAHAIGKYFPNIDCNADYFCFNPYIPQQTELLNVFGSNSSLLLKDICVAMPWVTEDYIKTCAASSSLFLYTPEHLVIRTDSIIFDAEELKNARECISSQLLHKGYAALDALNLTKTADYNPLLSADMLSELLVRQYFKDAYLAGPRVARQKSAPVHMGNRLRDFCSKHKRFSLKELDDFSKDETGAGIEAYVEIPQGAALQIDKENFVALDTIRFDIQAIDAALAVCTNGQPIPVWKIRDFSFLPALSGHHWNGYLLTSYCLLKSAKFSLVRPRPNNECIGFICPRRKNLPAYEQLFSTWQHSERMTSKK